MLNRLRFSLSHFWCCYLFPEVFFFFFALWFMSVSQLPRGEVDGRNLTFGQAGRLG